MYFLTYVLNRMFIMSSAHNAHFQFFGNSFHNLPSLGDLDAHLHLGSSGFHTFPIIHLCSKCVLKLFCFHIGKAFLLSYRLFSVFFGDFFFSNQQVKNCINGLNFRRKIDCLFPLTNTDNLPRIFQIQNSSGLTADLTHILAD